MFLFNTDIKEKKCVKRLTKIIDDDLGYRLLLDYIRLVQTLLGWQNVSATTDKIDLPYKSIHWFQIQIQQK